MVLTAVGIEERGLFLGRLGGRGYGFGVAGVKEAGGRRGIAGRGAGRLGGGKGGGPGQRGL